MRKALVWLTGALGLAALYRALRRRQAPARAIVGPATDPADELRAAIADATAEEDEGGEPLREAPPSLAERRRRVHERAQEAIDSMREPPQGA
jgi:hypothetical protein